MVEAMKGFQELQECTDDEHDFQEFGEMHNLI